jgi:hypothetical protein
VYQHLDIGGIGSFAFIEMIHYNDGLLESYYYNEKRIAIYKPLFTKGVPILYFKLKT